MTSSFGEFFKQKRCEKELTQKELADLLFVSASAVSKWEKGVAHPDITLLPKLSEILGVSEHELITASMDKQARQEKSQAKKWRALTNTWKLFFIITYSIALLTCFICNLAVSGTLDWFWIVLSAILLAFSFTNLPKLIKKYKLILIPLANYLSLSILLGVCAIYTKGNWFWVATFSVFLGLIIIFTPIYISKYKIFNKIKKYNDFVSIGIDFVAMNILLFIIENYTLVNNYSSTWYLKTALPIVLINFAVIILLLTIKFLKINGLLKASLILFIIDVLAFIPPLFIKINNTYVQEEIDDLNILNTDFSKWSVDNVDTNVFCIIAITIISLSVIFLIFGLLKHRKKNTK